MKALKIFALSLMTGFFTLSGPSGAMEQEEPFNKQEMSSPTQSAAYAKSLFEDAVLKDETFTKLFREYQEAPLSANVFSLAEQMKVYYEKYRNECVQKNVTPYIPVDPRLSFLVPPSKGYGWSAEAELEKMFINQKDKQFSSPTDLTRIYGMINEILFPKYKGPYKFSGFQAIKLDLPFYGAGVLNF